MSRVGLPGVEVTRTATMTQEMHKDVSQIFRKGTKMLALRISQSRS